MGHIPAGAVVMSHMDAVAAVVSHFSKRADIEIGDPKCADLRATMGYLEPFSGIVPKEAHAHLQRYRLIVSLSLSLADGGRWISVIGSDHKMPATPIDRAVFATLDIRSCDDALRVAPHLKVKPMHRHN